MKKLVLIVFLAGIFSGCATLPEPSDTNSTLVTGRIVHEGKDYEKSKYFLINGIHKYGITLNIMDIVTGKVIKLETNNDGYFYSTKFDKGQYVMRDIMLYIDAGNIGNSHNVGFDNPESLKFFKVARGKVNNLGVINWESVFKRGITIYMNKEYTLVQEYYKAMFSGSNWLNREWIPVNVIK